MEENTPENNELPMNWWKFWQYFSFPAGIILSILSLIQYSGIELSRLNIFGWAILIGNIGMVIFLCVTYMDFTKRKEGGYKLFMYYLLISSIWNVAINTLDNAFSNPFMTFSRLNISEVVFTFLISYIIVFGIWVYPNYLYFKKRKALFCN